MGDDFAWENAFKPFKEIDKLIRHLNEGDYNMNVFYSTPNTYVDAVKKENADWPVKTDDFFPYSDNKHSYWTGYFTSRPGLKSFIRKSGSLLRA
jgi:hypothetical protein